MKSLLVGIEATETPGPWYGNLASTVGQLASVFESDIAVVGVEHTNLAAPLMLEGSWGLLEDVRRQATEMAGDVFQRFFTSAHQGPKASWAGVIERHALGAYARTLDLTL